MGRPKIQSDEFLKRSNVVHDHKYEYNLEGFSGSRSNVLIYCQKHGRFEQKAFLHLRGSGCQKCAHDWHRINYDEFIKKANEIYNNKYLYPNFKNKQAKDKIKVICEKHGEFFVSIDNHLRRKSGCKKCAIENRDINFTYSKFLKSCMKSKFDPRVYVIRCNEHNEDFVKIGISSTEVHQRFKGRVRMPYDYWVAKEIKGSPRFVWLTEKALHEQFKKYKYIPEIKFAGYTECYNIEILKMI